MDSFSIDAKSGAVRIPTLVHSRYLNSKRQYPPPLPPELRDSQAEFTLPSPYSPPPIGRPRDRVTKHGHINSRKMGAE